ncbi:ATP-binding protein [Bradyrhizobium oligotrophicum]|uniref:ATP-binding protein n=1 Tax=Bradyrhizobium oligotrophicum TaxID=44255 RepID=UPI003EBF1F68
MRQNVVYSFGPFRLFPDRQLLILDGAAVKLGGRAFELLHVLVERSSELISKEDLMAAAWPGTFVHESNLKVNMHSLRRSLGDTQKQSTYIATIARRGYRFVAPVQRTVADADETQAAPDTSRASRLPVPRDVIAREREIARLLDLLHGTSQVTVVGPAGVGKTTVAIAAAHMLEKNCADGVCFVDLATINDPALLPSALVAALGLRGDMGDPLSAAVAYLQDRSMLVLLDNCEHVQPAVTIFARSFSRQSGPSKVLATSREPLRVPAETVMWLDPLDFPADRSPASLDDILSFPAVELFARRASEWTGYQLVEADVDAVVHICRSVDGLPLAIELLAGELDDHPVQDLAARLNQHLGFHADRSTAVPGRHDTLLAAIDWSFGLLSPQEADTFRLASVFADAFDLEDVIAVAAKQGLSPIDVTVGLGGLVIKSLLTAQVDGPGLRYRLLDSTRRYAAKRLDEAGLAARSRRWHAERILTLFEQSEAEWGWRDSGDWTQRYKGRLADVQAALAWAFGDGGNAELGVRLTTATVPLWFETSLISDTQARVKVALDHAEALQLDDLLKAKLAIPYAWSMMYARRFPPETEDTWMKALAYARRAGHLHSEFHALVGLAVYLMDVGRIADAIARLQQFRTLCDGHEDWSMAPEGERTLAWARAHTGHLAESLEALERLAVQFPRIGRDSRMAGFQVDRSIGIRNYTALFAWVSGRPDHAASTAREAIELADTLGHLASQSNVLALACCPVSFLNGHQADLAHYTRKLGGILKEETIGIWLPIQRFYSAVSDDLGGDPTALARIKASIDELIDSRFVMRVPAMMGILAERYLRRGLVDEANDAIALGLHYEARQDERWCRSELMRIEALILRQSGRHDRAERLLLDAIDDAHAIMALSFELRAASDLAAYYLEAHRPKEAFALLSPIYRRFSEGFATEDLVMASQLLRRANTAATGRASHASGG